jgi:hypothetical protein
MVRAMFDAKPDSYDDLTAWYRHFRMTKHLPAMPAKLAAAMRDAPDNHAARFVMTGYAAAAIDIALFLPASGPTGIGQDIEFLCGIKPAWLQTLSVNEIAQPLKITAEELTQRMRASGFAIDDKGIIGIYTPPATAAASRPSPLNPKI